MGAGSVINDDEVSSSLVLHHIYSDIRYDIVALYTCREYCHVSNICCCRVCFHAERVEVSPLFIYLERDSEKFREYTQECFLLH